MLPKQKRLSRALWASLRAIKGSKQTFSPLGTLKYYPYATPHVSVVVSSKHEKKAILRNSLKRRIYSFYMKYPIESGIFIFFPSKQAYTLPYETLIESFDYLFKKNTKY